MHRHLSAALPPEPTPIRVAVASCGCGWRRVFTEDDAALRNEREAMAHRAADLHAVVHGQPAATVPAAVRRIA